MKLEVNLDDIVKVRMSLIFSKLISNGENPSSAESKTNNMANNVDVSSVSSVANFLKSTEGDI